MASNEHGQSGRRPPRWILGVDCAGVWFLAQAYIPDISSSTTPASLSPCFHDAVGKPTRSEAPCTRSG